MQMKKKIVAENHKNNSSQMDQISAEEIQEYTVLLFPIAEDVPLEEVMKKAGSIDILSIERDERGVLLSFFSYFEMFKVWQEIRNGVFIGKKKIIPTVEKCKMDKKKRESVYLAHTAGGTRKVMLSEIEDFMNEEFVREEAEKFGKIAQIVHRKEKKQCQIEFFSFISAMNFAVTLKEDSMLQGIRISFVQSSAEKTEADINIMNTRTVYMGGLVGDISAEEVLANIKGGVIFNAKILREKRCAFVTFFDYVAAAAFIEYANAFSLCIRGMPVKIGLGKIQPLPSIAPFLAYMEVTRCIVLEVGQTGISGEIEKDLLEYGEIEKIEEKESGVYHVYFMNTSDAYAAHRQLSENIQWAECLRGYGEDHCAIESTLSLILTVQKKEFSV